MSDACRILACIGCVVATLACGAGTVLAPTYVQFKIDAPFCGSTPNTYQFSIDGTVIGVDTLKHGQLSRVYTTSPGLHGLRARLPNAPNFLQDTTATLNAGTTFTDMVGLYCS